MNRIYKVIWNEALNCFTAVGEYAKGRGKSSKSSVSSNATINTTSNVSAIKTLRLSAMGLGLLAAGFGMQANATGSENHHDGDYSHSHGSHGVHTHTSGNNSHNSSGQGNPSSSIALKFEGDNATTITRTNGETLNILGGATGTLTNGNIGVFGIGDTLTVKLAQKIDLGTDGSLKMGDTLVDNSGIKITASSAANNVTLSSSGLNNGGNQITNVASGVGNDSNAANIGDLNNAVAANKTKYYSVNSTAVGNANNDGATGPNAMAMGGNASATGGQAIAIGSGQSGQNTVASGQQSIAIGANVVSKGHSSIAVGGDDLDDASKANIDGTSVSTLNGGDVNTTFFSYTGRDLVETTRYKINTESGGAASIAIGAKALSEGALSTAIGVQSSSSGVASSAFGIGASASEKGSVALGAGSVANVAGGVAGYVPTGVSTAGAMVITNTQSGANSGAVSIGSSIEGGTRQIVNVAAGTNDSDAVNVSQLKALDTVVAGIDFPIRSSNAQPYTTSVTGADALAVGSNANANGSNSTVVGENAFGNANATVIGEGARSSFNGFAGGQDAKAGVNSVAIGQRATNGTASRAVAIGYEAKATANDTVALGLDAQAPAVGGVALGKGSRANALNSVALGQNSIAVVQSGASFLTNVAADADNGTVSVGAVGSERRIVNVAGGSADTDAVNVSQLKVVTETANRGWDISAQGDSATASTVEPSDSVDFNSKNSNITVSKTANSNDVSFELNNDLDLGNNGSVSTGNIFGGTQVNRFGMATGGLAMGGVTTVSGVGVTVTGTNPLSNATLTSDGLSLINGPSITKSNGINAGNKKVVNVADGVSAKDAVNVSQLNSASAAARTKVVKGTNVASVDFSTDSITGQDVYTVNANASKTSAGSTAIDVSATTDASNLTDYTVDLSQGTKDSLIKADNSVQYDNLAKTSVTLGNIGSTTPVTLTNVAAGEISEDSSDAVNGSQLFETNTKVDKGFALKAADGNTVQKSLGQAVEVVGSNENIDTRVRNGKIEVKLNNDLDLGSNGSVSTGNIFGGTQVNRFGMATGGLAMGGVTTVSGVGVTVTGTNPLSNATLTSDGLSLINGPSITKSNGINAGNKKVVNVADGVSAKDAVNVSQLNSTSAAAKTEVAAGTNVADVVKSTGQNGQDVYTVNADGVTTSAGSSAVTVTAGAKDATNITDYAVDLSADSKASLVKADSAMQSVVTQIDGEDVKTLTKDNNTANFLSGKNIVLSDENGDIKVATVEDASFTSVTTGNTLLNTGGVSFLGGSTVRLSSMGLDNGGNQITNVGDGAADTDAVNIRQLNGVIETANKGWDISAQGNSTTASNVGPGEAVDFNSKNSNIRVSKTANSNDVSFELNNNLDLGDNGSVEMGSSSPFGLGSTTTLDRSGLTTGNSYFSTTVDGLGVRTGNGLINTTVSSVGVAVSSPLSTTLLSGNGLNIIGGPSVTKSGGINAGNKKVINVDDGVQAKDAVNVSQLNSASAAAKTEVAAGTNVTDVVKSTGQNGQDVYTVNADGVTTSAGSSAVTVTAGAKDATNITDYAVDLSADSKASLVKADSAMQSVITQIDGNEVKTLDKTNNTANFLTGDNIVLSAEDGGIKVSTAENVTFTSVTTGDTLLNTGGVSFLGGSTVRLSSMGLDNGGNQITNVASGVGNDFNAANIGDVNRASATAKTEVTAGTNVADVVKSTGQNGQDVYTVNADGVTASAGSSAVTITAGAKDATNITDYQVDLSESSKNSLVNADNALQTVVTQIDGNEVKTLDKTNNTANFLTGDNIVLSAEDGGIKVSTAENVTFTSVTTGDTLLNTGGVSFLGGSTVRLSSMGLDNGGNRITEVADGEDDTDAVNVRQLNATNSTVDLGLDFTGDDTAVVVNRKLGQTLTIQGGATELTENNIGVVADEEGNLNVRLAEDVMLGRDGSVRIESTVLNNAGVTITDGPNQTITLSNEGLDNGNNRIIKVGEGIAPTDAVNFAQLTTTNNEIAKGIKIGDGNSDNDQQFALGDTINITGDSNLTTTASATGVQVTLNNQLDLGDEGRMQIGNSIMNSTGFTFVDNGMGRTVRLSSTGLDNGGNPIRNVGRGELNSDAVNVGQLREVTIALDRGWDITAQGDVATQVRQGDAIDLNSRDGNIKVSRTLVNNGAALNANTRLAAVPAGANDISFDLNPDISVVSVTAGDTTINDNGLTIAGGPSITKSGIDAADNKVTNVQNGEVTAESQDAINGSQLYAQGTGISSIIGGNTVYNPDDGSFTNSNIGGTGQSNIDGAIASIRQGTIEINENVQVNTTNITNNTTDIAANTTNIATNTSNIMTNTTNITTNTTNIKTNTDRLDAGLNFGADSGATINKPVGDESVLSFTGGNNITTTAEGSSIKFDLNGNISVDSVTAGNTVINSSGITMQDGPSMTSQGLYAGNQRLTGVADGIEPKDAVNYSQLSALDSRLNNNMNDLGYRIDEVEDDANAGISAAMAMSALPQAFISGKSLIGGGVSTYNGESAVAIGFSKLSNDGRWVIKVNGTADTQGNVGGAIGAGFHFD